jgi:tRNA-Thr(GGU) m(6)t(6)A37 methyltransferase TsaA
MTKQTANRRSPLTLSPIGCVQNSIKDTLPPDQIKAVPSRIILDPAFVEGLDGLLPGQRLMVIFHFHLSKGYDLKQHPPHDLTRPARGVFALRTPQRPNPIGVTVVDLIEINDNILLVHGLDAIDGTPVLDLKPG